MIHHMDDIACKKVAEIGLTEQVTEQLVVQLHN